MKYLTFHAVNALLLLFVFGTILLWVIWTPEVSVPQTDKKTPTVNFKDINPPSQSTTTSPFKNSQELSSTKDARGLEFSLQKNIFPVRIDTLFSQSLPKT